MLRRLFVCCTLAFFTASLLPAQSQNASLDGQVTDETGASVPNATVTIQAAELSLSTRLTTDSSGRYAFPNLQPGTYTLRVTAPGFQTYEQQNIQLLANQAARIDAGLKVGSASTKIEVTADATQLNVDNGAQQEGVPPSVVNQLPLLVAGGTPRNAVQFISTNSSGILALNGRLGTARLPALPTLPAKARTCRPNSNRERSQSESAFFHGLDRSEYPVCARPD